MERPDPAAVRRRARRIRRHSQEPELLGRRLLGKIWIAMAVMLVLAGVQAWMSDFVTMEGHWTVYTGICSDGAVPCRSADRVGPRIRFQAHKQTGAVEYRLLGSGHREGILSACSVVDARNWSCPASAAAAAHLPPSVLDGHATPNDLLPYAIVSKPRWLLLRLGWG